MAVPQYELEPSEKQPIFKMMHFVDALMEINLMSTDNQQIVYDINNPKLENEQPYRYTRDHGLIAKIVEALKDESDGISVTIQAGEDMIPSFRMEITEKYRQKDQPEVIIATVNNYNVPGARATNLKFEGPSAAQEYQLADGVQIKEIDGRIADLLDKKVRNICRVIGLDVNTSGSYSLSEEELPLAALNDSFLNTLLDYSSTNITSILTLLDDVYKRNGQIVEMFEKYGSDENGEYVEFYYRDMSHFPPYVESAEDSYEDVGGLKIPSQSEPIRTKSMFVSAVSTTRLSLNSELLGGYNIRDNKPRHMQRIDREEQVKFLLNEIFPQSRKQALALRPIHGTKDVLRSSYAVVSIDKEHEVLDAVVEIDNLDPREDSEYRHDQYIYAQGFRNENTDYQIIPYTRTQKANLIRALFLVPDSY